MNNDGVLQCYLVGGAVRDKLLGRAAGDLDWVVVGATVAHMKALGFTQVGRDFPVFLHPETHDEYALARTERKSGRGHKGFEVSADPSVTLEQDLLRRDLTINAIAQDAEGVLIDPFGGAADLERQTLRHVSQAFVEDPLRIFRVARFAAQMPGFTVADETRSLMREIVAAGELATLSAERVWQELVKALAAPLPARFFEVLADAGAMTDWFVEFESANLLFSNAESAEDPMFRFAELPLSADEFRQFAARLKVPAKFLQAALDRLSWAETIATWASVDAQELSRAFDTLKVAHESVRLTWLLDWLSLTRGGDYGQLVALASGYKQVTVADTQAQGAEYGIALRKARQDWLNEKRNLSS